MDMVRVRNWKELWNDYIVEGLKKGCKPAEIRKNLVEAFRKEIFDMMAFRLKVDDLEQALHTPENEQIVINLTKNAKHKWLRLMQECRKYPETRSLLRESDLTLEDRDEETEEEEEDRFEYDDVEDPEEEYESSWDGDEKTAEWPELSEEDSSLTHRGADFDGLSDGPFEPKRESWTP